MTKKLFYDDPHLYNFTAKVISVEENIVELDQTAFYPEGGGQPADKGYLAGIEVLDVQKKDSRILHKLANSEGLSPGDSVKGQIDIEHRNEYIEQHTGQHILSAVFHNILSLPTISVHQGSDYTSIDFDTTALTKEQCLAMEDAANTVINENKAVTTEIIDSTKSEISHLRREPKVKNNIRVVKIDAVDNAACGGVHSESTGFVKLIKFVKAETNKTSTRTFWLIGKRAIQDYRNRFDIIDALCEKFSSQPKNLLENIQNYINKHLELESENSQLKREKSASRAKNLLEENREEQIIIAVLEDSDKDELLATAKALQKAEKTALLFSPNESRDYLWILAGSSHFNLPPEQLRSEFLPLIEGKGGGSAQFYQGIAKKIESSDKLLSKLRQYLIST